jgi:hypothetical protein
MSIELKEINRANFIECVLLTTNKEAYDENGETFDILLNLRTS